MPGYPAPQLLPGGGCESGIYRVWMYILRKGFMEVVGGRGMGMNGMEDAVEFSRHHSQPASDLLVSCLDVQVC